jgi:SAM-dependent methyltransferase
LIRSCLAPLMFGALPAVACGGAQTDSSPQSQPSSDTATIERINATESVETDATSTAPPYGDRPQDGHGQMQGHQHRFEDPAAYAARWESPERDAWQLPAVVVETMGIEPGMRVADIGTGTGYLLGYLSEATGPDGTVYAIDVEPAMVDWVTERAANEGWTNVAPLLAPFEGPGVDAATLDRAVMVNVWHHIEDRETYAVNLFDALAPGGSILIVETRIDAPDGPPMHYRMEPEAVIATLEAAGFAAELSEYGNVRQYAVLATRPAAD